jgi:hypothetical protein
VEVRIGIEEWADEGIDPGGQDSYYGWDLFVTVGRQTYYARRYRDDPQLVTFHAFSDPTVDEKDRRRPFWPDDPQGDRLEPFRGGVIPYDDPLFQTAVRAVLRLDGVTQIDVFTSNPTGLLARMDLARLPPEV